ncbi:MAG TPA: glycosyltransferase, partial [Victivallales bacterium]|nr:glycosyltransferase [Victivallales bacterium]
MKVSVVIPSFDGYRNGNLELLKSDLMKQTLCPAEIITVVGVSPNGKARNYGVKKTTGDFLMFIDDDVRLGDTTVIQKLIAPFYLYKDIGMTGPSQLIPPDSNLFQRISARQIPRSFFPIQKELIDSDMVSHMCLVMPVELFKEVGWENPEIISGTDPDLRYRVRKAGYRVCVAPECWAYHPVPKNLTELLKFAYLKGKNSAITQIQHPEFVYSLGDGINKSFQEKKTLLKRIFHALLNLTVNFFSFKIIFCIYRMSYSIGY